MLAPLLIFAGLAAPLLAAGVVLSRGPLALVRKIGGGQIVDIGIRVHSSLVRSVGRYPAALVILVLGLGAVFCICVPVGFAAHAVEGAFDVPILQWSQTQFSANDSLGRVTAVVTTLGDARPMAVIVTIAALVFAALWRKREWWAPGLVLGIGLVAELILQEHLAVTVNRGHPPTALGSFPSGGTARVMIVFGLIVVLWYLTRPELSRRRRRIGWVVVALATAVEGFTRLYLLQHWASDVVGGWVLGSLTLGVMIACTLTIARRDAHAAPAAAPIEASSVEKSARGSA